MAPRNYSGGSGVMESAVLAPSLKASGFGPVLDLHWLQDRANSLAEYYSPSDSLSQSVPALMISVMLVAILTVHKGHGFFTQTGGAELPILYIAAALTVTLAGPGQYSIDHALGLDTAIRQPVIVLILVCGVLSVIAALALRHSSELAPNHRLSDPETPHT